MNELYRTHVTIIIFLRGGHRCDLSFDGDYGYGDPKVRISHTYRVLDDFLTWIKDDCEVAREWWFGKTTNIRAFNTDCISFKDKDFVEGVIKYERVPISRCNYTIDFLASHVSAYEYVEFCKDHGIAVARR